jgi:hypothetical protein
MGLETLGTMSDARTTNPDTANLTIPQILRGMLYGLQNALGVAGEHRNALAAMADGERKQLQLDTFGRLIVTAGAGAPGIPGGEVSTVQGVEGMQPLAMRDGDEQVYVVGSGAVDFPLGSGAIGDRIKRIVVVPITNAGVGNVAIKDGSGAAQTIFFGAVLTDSRPHLIDLGVKSTLGGWKITTGALLTVWVIGRFTP